VSSITHCHNTPANAPISSSRTTVTPAKSTPSTRLGAAVHLPPCSPVCHSCAGRTRSEAKSRDSESIFGIAKERSAAICHPCSLSVFVRVRPLTPRGLSRVIASAARQSLFLPLVPVACCLLHAGAGRQAETRGTTSPQQFSAGPRPRPQFILSVSVLAGILLPPCKGKINQPRASPWL